MSTLTIRGAVSNESAEFKLGGVTVVAHAPATLTVPEQSAAAGPTLEIGRGVTDSSGVFEVTAREDDPSIARLVCALRACDTLTFTLSLLDGDALLTTSEPRSFSDGMWIELVLPDLALDHEPGDADWAALSHRMLEARTAQLSDIALELATLGPRRLFGDWTATRRLSLLRRLEQALLDPSGEFHRAGVALRLSQLTSPAETEPLRERLRREQRSNLLELLEPSLDRARAVGTWASLDLKLDPERLATGDVIGGVNHFIDDPVFQPGLFPWLDLPITGYRDYLRDRWTEPQRFEQVLGGPDKEVASRATMIARLNHRFHQDFATHDTKLQPANRVLVAIVLRMLSAPTGSGYGFGVAAATIAPQGAMPNREYLDQLIGLTGKPLEEIEKRFRLNLQRSDLETTSLVQQNVDTLQRFFTDSYQSVADPSAIKPDRKAAVDEPLIVAFPPQGAGPFFLEFEEWLALDEPFYPENHFDPRATYRINTDEHVAQKTRDAVFANSVPLAEALDRPVDGAKFVPGRSGYDHRFAKWQWVRSHLELQDLIEDAHADAKSLNPVAAEQKYALAQAWAERLQRLVDLSPTGWWEHDPAAVAKAEKNTDVGSMDKLMLFERRSFLYLGWHYRVIPEYGDLLAGNTEISERWWGRFDIFGVHGFKGTVAGLLDQLAFRLLPACLSEVQLAQGKYADAVRQLIAPAAFNVFAAAPDAKPFDYPTGGPLPYASSSDRSVFPPPKPATRAATNPAELGYFRLKLGNATLEWADALYRSNQPESIVRARELYKAVLFLHGDDPAITPTWSHRGRGQPPLPVKKSSRNPAVLVQTGRARLGFVQINAGLNYYAVSPAHVPPVRFRVLKEAADRFAAGARAAQTDFLGYMQLLDQLTVSEMTARTMVAKATAAIGIAQEQQKIAEFGVGEVQKQVDAINAQIVAKQAEIKKADDFFEQAKDFAGGMKDAVGKLGETAFAGEGATEAASAETLSSGDVMKLAMKFGSGGGDMSAATGALGSSMAVAGPFAAFLYAGVTSITAMAAAAGKRLGELKALQNALPAAKALVELKKRDVTIAKLSQDIAKADAQLGKDLLAFYATRLLNRSFLVNLTEFSNRLMRRYLDLAGRTAWSAERSLAFEQDRELSIVAFDYFPRNLRGVTGADLLQLHLAELDAARIQGLTQTIPVKQTFSLARDYPAQFGQLKKTGACRFTTLEAPLTEVYPGVYGYRVRNVTVSATYADAIQPHRGLLTNQGASVVTRREPASAHMLLRYPDALPLSEFRLRNDMWVFDLPDETLLPFEGSGIETTWELALSKAGNVNGFASLTDVFLTFDMRANYSATLAQQHLADMPTTVSRSLLVSAKTVNPGALAAFRKDGGQVVLEFDLGKLARNANETARKLLNLIVVAVGTDDAPFTATFSAPNPALNQAIDFDHGVALSNAGVLAGGNGGVPLPLTAFVGADVDQVFTLALDADANPGAGLSRLHEVLLMVEYEAAV